MKKGGTVYAYLRLRHRQAPSLIDKHKQSTPCRGVNFPGLFPLASNWRFSDEGVRTEVQLNVVALRRGRVWFFECGFNRVRQSFLCRPANCSDVARQRQIYCLFGEQHRPGHGKMTPGMRKSRVNTWQVWGCHPWVAGRAWTLSLRYHGAPLPCQKFRTASESLFHVVKYTNHVVKYIIHVVKYTIHVVKQTLSP